MLGEPKGVVCYKCVLTSNVNGTVVGEGRGAWDKNETPKRPINAGIKQAEKRAFVDAVKRTCCLSGRFTQDSPEHRNKLKIEKQRLISEVAEKRAGVESDLTDLNFIKLVARNYIHGTATTIGQVRKLRKVIVDDDMYDLATGERIPD